MKKYLLLLLFIPLMSFGQYSTYYGAYDVNVNSDVNINANIKEDVNITKTVTTIDYGALANANAVRETNRIESLKIANERERDAMIAIANDPSKAFDYGKDNTWVASRKIAESYGFKKFTYYHKKPNQILFNSTGGYNYQNISENFIITEIELVNPLKVSTMKNKNDRIRAQKNLNGIFKNLEEYSKLPNYTEGEISDGVGFIHKKDINKTKIFGINGFKATLVYENDYEIIIKDNYYATLNGIIYRAGVRYKGDKDEVTFEQLEGRRYYFRRLVDKIISTQIFSNFK